MHTDEAIIIIISLLSLLLWTLCRHERGNEGITGAVAVREEGKREGEWVGRAVTGEV